MAVQAVLRFSVLGPVTVTRGTDTLDLGPPKQRAVLALLVMHANAPLTTDRMIEELWGERAPRSAAATLQAYVSNLRRPLEPDRRARMPGTVLVTTSGGYRLTVPPDSLDHLLFGALVEDAAGLVESAAARARPLLVEALDLWRGPAYAEFQYEAFAQPEIARLEEIRNTAIEMRIACDLSLGRAADLVPELDLLVTQHPMRERLRRHQMLALYRAGRQTDALASYQRFADELRDELGLDPGRELSDLYRAVLDHDPCLLVGTPRQVRSPTTRPVEGPTSHAPHLVGRDEEHRLFRAALSDASLGCGSILLFDGEPGIGKTRLLERLHHEAHSHGLTSAFARCVEVGGTPPFWPWAQLVRQLEPDDVAAAAGAYAVHLGPLLPPDPLRNVEEPSPLFRVAEGVAAALRTLGFESPIALFLDDLYSSDPDSLSLLTLIGAELDRLPVVIVGTHRGTDLGTKHPLTIALDHLARFDRVRRHTLHRFGLQEVGEIVRNVVGGGIEETVIAAIHNRTNGNAFFTVELTKLLATKDQLDPGGALSEVPITVGQTVDQRIDRLSPGTVHLLRVAAVVGREFDLETIGEALTMPLGDAVEAVHEAVRAGLLSETDRPGTFRFTHIIVVDAVIHSLGAVRRAQLHGLVADSLERTYPGSPAVLTSIAHHRVHAIPVGGSDAAIASLEHAGHHAIESDALELAEQLFQQRLTIVDERSGSACDEPFRIAALLDLIRVWTRKEGYHSPRITEATQELWGLTGIRHGTFRFDVSGPFTQDHPVLCALQARFSNLTVLGDFLASHEVACRFQELAEMHPDPYVIFSANLPDLVVAVAAGRVDDALRASERAEAALDVIDPDSLGLVNIPLGQQSARVAFHCFSGWAHVLAGDRARGEREFQSARRCCDRLQSGFNTGFCVAVECEAAATANSPHWALDAFEWGRADVGRGVFGLWDVWHDVLAAWAHGMTGGDPGRAADRIRINLSSMQDEGALVVHGLFWALTASLEQRAGRLDLALDATERGIRQAESLGERNCYPDLERRAASIYADLGRFDDRRAALHRAEIVAAELGLHSWFGQLDSSTVS